MRARCPLDRTRGAHGAVRVCGSKIPSRLFAILSCDLKRLTHPEGSVGSVRSVQFIICSLFESSWWLFTDYHRVFVYRNAFMDMEIHNSQTDSTETKTSRTANTPEINNTMKSPPRDMGF
jgi:hypothetical protein